MEKGYCFVPLLLALALLTGCGGASPAATAAPLPTPETRTETQIPTAAPEPTPEPTPEPAADPGPAYTAYLELLESERERILSYNWQKGNSYESDTGDYYVNPGTAQVAFADVWGDGVPELIYLRGVEAVDNDPIYAAELRIMGYGGEGLRELYFRDGMHAVAGGGTDYSLFLIPGTNGVWLHTQYYGEDTFESYEHLTESESGKLESVYELNMEQRYDLDSYYPVTRWFVNSEEVSEGEYMDCEPDLCLQGRGLLLRSLSYRETGLYPEEPTLLPRDGSGMPVDTAIRYLKVLTGQWESADAEDFFAALPDLYFASGVGGWSTGLSFSDATDFYGPGAAELSFHDSDMGDTGEGYPNGTVYVCTCTVHFSGLQKLDDYRYLARVSEMNLDGPEVGEAWFEDGVRYIQSVPYGLEEADKVLICLPGTPTAELPRELLQWLGMPRAWGRDFPLTLPCYALYSFNDQTAFGS